jgi:MFS family permease
MRVNTLLLALGPVAEALAPNVGALAVGRFISGMGAGVSVVTVPLYISEIAPPAEKGFFGAFTQIMTNMGILITQTLGYFLSHGSMWRVILAVAGGIGVLQLFALLGASESPKWLAENKDPKDAKAVLKRIRGQHVKVEDEVAGWGIESPQEIDGRSSPIALFEMGVVIRH